MKGIKAGFFIALSYYGYLMLPRPFGFVFGSLGFLIVSLLSLPLFTTRIRKDSVHILMVPSLLLETLKVLFWNMIGSFLCVLILRWTGNFPVLELPAIHLGNSFFGALICGVVFGNCALIYQRKGYSWIYLLGVPLILGCGFPYILCEPFYIFSAGDFDWRILLHIPLVILGNWLGSNLYWLSDNPETKKNRDRI